MTRILAIDPGSEQSAFLMLHVGRLHPIGRFGIRDNDELAHSLRSLAVTYPADIVVIEQIESYGMAVGREVFATVHWAGRFTEAARPTPVVQLPRRDVKLAICGDTRARDSNIRQALVDRFGGKATAIGRKAAPGPLYGISKDVWSALAIALTYSDREAVA